VVEVKDRKAGERVTVPVGEAVAHVAKLVADAKTALAPVTQHP
jgi:hypothetical protein